MVRMKVRVTMRIGKLMDPCVRIILTLWMKILSANITALWDIKQDALDDSGPKP